MALDKIGAPFTQEQIVNINKNQYNSSYHPLTCCGGSNGQQKGCERVNNEGEGILIAKVDGLTCPCGEYKQTWTYSVFGK